MKFIWEIWVDTTKHFGPLQSNGYLDEIVRNSPWEVEVGNLDDFRQMREFAKNMTPNELEKNAIPFPSFGIPHFLQTGFCVNKSNILSDLDGVALNWVSLHR